MSQNKKNVDAVPQPTRRNFLTRIWIILGFVVFVEILWLFVSFLKPRKNVKNFGKNAPVICGPIDRFEPGSVTAFPQGKFYLVRLEEGGFLALSRECTHLGCTVPWVPDENRFVCPCHASSFDITGNVINPPAPRALDLFPVEIENDFVKVDVSTARKRKRFEAGQAVRAF